MRDPLAGLPLDDAITACTAEVVGDWFRDPWGWPELAIAKSEVARPALRDAARSAGSASVADIDVPKSNFGVRPAVVLPVSHRVVYQAAALAISTRTALPASFVFGWRCRDVEGKRVLARNEGEWHGYLSGVDDSLAQSAACVQTDISSFFASVPTDRLIETCHQASPGGNAISFVAEFIERFGKQARHSGLPQRSTASAMLANLYLQPLDFQIEQLIDGGALTAVVRWMDDIWLFGSEPRVRAVQLNMQTWLRDLGLEMNLGKTHLLVGEEREDALEEERLNEATVPEEDMQTLASSGARSKTALRVSRALELEERILCAPYYAARPLTKYVLKSLRLNGNFERLEDWLEQAWRMPHVADAIARYIIDAQDSTFSEWLADFLKGQNSLLAWSNAQLATAVPVTRLVPALRPIFDEWLVSGNVMLTAVAVSRLLAWVPDETRARIRDLAASEANPSIQRLYLWAMLALGEERAHVRRCAEIHSENQLTAVSLAEMGFQPRRITRDYAAISTQ